MSGRPHPEVYLQFGKYDHGVGRSDLKCWTTKWGVLAGWLYKLEPIAVSVMFAHADGWDPVPDIWHPHPPTGAKRFRIADFQYKRRAARYGDPKAAVAEPGHS
jgi:hypothetical protein